MRVLQTTPTSTVQENVLDRWGQALAIGGTLAWAVVYILIRPVGVGDELTHFEVIQHLVWGNWQLPSNLAMLPTYHWMVYAVALGHPTIEVARLFSTVMAVLALLIFGKTWRDYHGTSASVPTLLLATLPILQPFTGMVYTDVTALAFLLGAWNAQLSRRYALAALLLAVACLLRQTNIIWGGFFAAWEAQQASLSERSWRAVPKAIFPRVVWLMLLAVVFAGLVATTGTLFPAPIPENRPAFNIANIHMIALLWTVFMAPVWLRQIPSAAQWLRQRARERPLKVVLFALGTALAIGVFAFTYKNPHPWNRPLAYWEHYHLHYLRNWPLVAMETSAPLRWISGVIIVGSLFSATTLIAQQRKWREVLLAVAFGCILVAPHFLVDPRYYITPAVFLLFFIRLPERYAASLAYWWIFLCVSYAPFILAGRSIW